MLFGVFDTSDLEADDVCVLCIVYCVLFITLFELPHRAKHRETLDEGSYSVSYVRTSALQRATTQSEQPRMSRKW